MPHFHIHYIRQLNRGEQTLIYLMHLVYSKYKIKSFHFGSRCVDPFLVEQTGGGLDRKRERHKEAALQKSSTCMLLKMKHSLGDGGSCKVASVLLTRDRFLDISIGLDRFTPGRSYDEQE